MQLNWVNRLLDGGVLTVERDGTRGQVYLDQCAGEEFFTHHTAGLVERICDASSPRIHDFLDSVSIHP